MATERKPAVTVQYQSIAFRKDSDISRVGVRKLADEVQVEVYQGGDQWRFPVCTGRADPKDAIMLARALLESVGATVTDRSSDGAMVVTFHKP